MKCLMKISILFTAIAVVWIALNQAGVAADLEEKTPRGNSAVSRDKTLMVKIMIDSADGKPQVNMLQLDYLPFLLLKANLTLAVMKGSCKIELLENDESSIFASTQGGKIVKANGLIKVNEEGMIRYRVTAKKAKNVVIDLTFSPFQEEPRISNSYSEDKLSLNGDGIKLKLSCTAGKNCLVRALNMSRSKAYRNLFFQIDYKIMTGTEVVEKSKCGTIEDIIPPDKTAEWPVDLVFGEPPKDIRISVLKIAEANADAGSAPARDQQKDKFIKMLPTAPLSGHKVVDGNRVK